MDREFSLRGMRFTQTDIVRFSVIASLTLCAILIAAVTVSRNDGILYAQLFYFPILYTTYFYPKKGIVLSGICGIVYECLVYVTFFPDAVALWSATGQAVLFICVALAVAYFTNLIRISEARYRSIFENSLLGIVLFDKNRFSITMVNQQLATVLGYTTAELSQISFADLFYSREYQRKFFENLGSGEDIRNFETCFATKAKEPHWANLSWSRIDETIISCSVIDIDAEKRARKEAADSSARYRQVTESSPTGIVITEGTTIRFANPEFSKLTGYEPDECAGRDLTGKYPAGRPGAVRCLCGPLGGSGTGRRPRRVPPHNKERRGPAGRALLYPDRPGQPSCRPHQHHRQHRVGGIPREGGAD